MLEFPIHCVDYENFPPDFDMVDNKYDYTDFKPLASALAVVNQKLTPVYITYDRSAIRRQYYHTVITKLFIASGAIAVIAATIQLINKTLDIPHIFNLPGDHTRPVRRPRHDPDRMALYHCGEFHGEAARDPDPS